MSILLPEARKTSLVAARVDNAGGFPLCVLVIFASDAHQTKVLVAGEYERYTRMCEQNGHTIGWKNREPCWKGSVIVRGQEV